MTEFTVEHHAVFYGLVARAVIDHDPRKGLEHLLEATRQYGRARGKRMAEQAVKDGCPLSPAFYMIYGELPVNTGNSKSKAFFRENHMCSQVFACGWLEAWKAHGLLEYGRHYCDVIDESVYEGFNPELTLTVDSRLSYGEAACGFDWGSSNRKNGDISQEVMEAEKRKALLGDSFRKDFLFHTRQLYEIMGQSLRAAYPENGNALLEEAVAEFGHIFGKQAMEALIQ